jgi:hypothetical protein
VDDGTWHFNATGLPGAVIGSQKKLAVWVTADDVGVHVLGTPVTFNCCDATSTGCSSAPCLSEMAPAPAPACADLSVIRTIAPRSYRVGLDGGVTELARSVKSGGGFKFPPVILDYNLEHSTRERAVWSGRGLIADVSLFLAVKRSACGGLCAELTLQRLVNRGVPAPLVWESLTFDLAKGGTLISSLNDASSASVLVVTPERGAADRAAPAPAVRAEAQPAARRGNRRATRR